MTGAAPSNVTLSPLVETAWLAAALDEVAVLDIRSPHDYLAGHIPGSLSLPVGNAVVSDTRRSRLTELAGSIEQLLAERGVDSSGPVVVVDGGDGTGSFALHLLELAGVPDVRILRGGYSAWVAVGQPTETAPTIGTPTRLEITPSLATTATIDNVREAAAGLSDAILVDTRSALEHSGVVGAPCCAYRGCIPLSRHLEWTSLLSAAGGLHDPIRIRAEAVASGLDREDDLIVYCHSGHRSSIAAVALRSAGFANVRTWLGSWHEWAALGLPRSEG